MTIETLLSTGPQSRRRLLSPLTTVAALLSVGLVLAAVLAPLIAPHDPFDPATLDLMDGMTPPLTPNAFTGRSFLLGTDNQGRDVLSSILYGSRVSLLVAFCATALALSIGVGAGLVSGYAGGVVDAVIMRIADAQLTFPTILVALLIFGIAQGLVSP